MKHVFLIGAMSTIFYLAAPVFNTADAFAASGDKACCQAERRTCDNFCATLSRSSERYPRCKDACRQRTFSCYRTGFYQWDNRPTVACAKK